ncbi:MAG: reductive dehalogenase [Bacteroidales bacterium]|nr:reductive dehalogenase [Bacteroidales bacterium]
MKALLFTFSGIIALTFFLFAIVFIFEKEKRASLSTLLIGTLISLPFFITGMFFSTTIVISYSLIAIYSFLGIVLLLPTSPNKYKVSKTYPARFDEREIMFSRAELVPETERFKEYYENHPNHKLLDDKFREKPGLMSEKSQKYHPLKFASANANFEVVHSFVQNIKDSEIKSKIIETSPLDLSIYLKKWAKQLGVVSIGICKLKDEHLYSHKGRGAGYALKIEKKHSFAIAFSVEMDKKMMDLAPDAETVLESSQQYLNAGAIAAQIAVFIRNLGYSARPHFDGNYEVICPLVARDAGLGEIGRMGLLMTPELGPRVRIGVVTTDIPLLTDSYKADYSVFDFCTKCKKCADNCPSRAISFENMKEKNGVTRWTINHEACFTYWTIVGTDCGKCMQVCPYSHPNNFMHNLVRKGIKNSHIFASFALKMDDVFYGRKPGNKKYKSPFD